MKLSRVARAAAAVAAAAVAVLAVPQRGPMAEFRAAWGAVGQEALEGQGCDRDGVLTALQPVFEPSTGYAVVAVEVSGIDPGCAGHHISVALTDGSAAVAAQSEQAIVPPGGGPVTLPVPLVAVEKVAKVHTLLD